MKFIFLILFFNYFQKPSLLNNQMATFTLTLQLLSLAHATHHTEEEFIPTFSPLLLHVHAALCCLVCLCCFRKQLAFGEWGTSEFSLLASGLLSDCFRLPLQIAGGGSLVKYDLELNRESLPFMLQVLIASLSNFIQAAAVFTCRIIFWQKSQSSFAVAEHTISMWNQKVHALLCGDPMADSGTSP